MKTADARIREALKRIEHAQAELYEACSDLSPIIGMAKQWEAVGKEADRVKALWHRVNGVFLSRERWEVDTL